MEARPGPITRYHSTVKPPITTVMTSSPILRRAVPLSAPTGNRTSPPNKTNVNANRSTSPGLGNRSAPNTPNSTGNTSMSRNATDITAQACRVPRVSRVRLGQG
jgi:hypothetical protein